jgi:hypothetical protein
MTRRGWIGIIAMLAAAAALAVLVAALAPTEEDARPWVLWCRVVEGRTRGGAFPIDWDVVSEDPAAPPSPGLATVGATASAGPSGPPRMFLEDWRPRRLPFVGRPDRGKWRVLVDQGESADGRTWVPAVAVIGALPRAEPDAGVAGTWALDIEMPDGTRTVPIALRADGAVDGLAEGAIWACRGRALVVDEPDGSRKSGRRVFSLLLSSDRRSCVGVDDRQARTTGRRTE